MSDLDRKKMMANMGFPETEEGFRDALDFIIAEVNKAGGLKAPKELRDKWRDSLPSRVLRLVEDEGLNFSNACFVIDGQDGKKEATERQLRRMVKEKVTVRLKGEAKIVDGKEVLPAYDFEVEIDKFPELVKFLRN